MPAPQAHGPPQLLLMYEFGDAPKRPSAHCAADTSEYDPGRQYVPAGQLNGSAEPPTQIRPAGHTMPAAVVLPAEQYNPAGELHGPSHEATEYPLPDP